jgi:hypothetical protein
VAEPSRSPSGEQTAMAIFVPPKSSPATTGGCATRTTKEEAEGRYL